ncbi:glycosyltransferase [Haloparvum sedimenti]|uniref:glycosyltransferase n=1 Tax=Haloparvum sedimenti TaxID=1678448 RepID=UPI00071E6F07|nr:glycosyltransferase [Haloparvum sedimenti]
MPSASADGPPASVILPTVRWTDACDQVATQLRPDDELLIVCDDASDPVAARRDDGSLPDGVRIVLAGEPEGCSGKANAIAVGMEAATHDRIVWTDDDFDHPPAWLPTLLDDYEARGATTEVPFFAGKDPFSTFLEPMNALGGSLSVRAGGIAWAGAVVFDRADLDEAAFHRDLRSAVSDDGTLSEHVDVTPVGRTRRVSAGGNLRATLERHVRFVKIVRFHDPRGMVGSTALAAVGAAAGVAFPLPTLLVATLLMVGVYAVLGVRRWTALLAYPAMLAAPLLLAYGLGRRTFVWGGRRYRWRARDDVRVVDRGPQDGDR